MNKINAQSINLGGQKSEISKSNDVLGALFSLPLIPENQQTTEITVSPKIGKIIDFIKSKKSSEKLDIKLNDFLSNYSKIKGELKDIKSEKIFELNSEKPQLTFALNVKILDHNLNKLIKKNISSQKNKIFKNSSFNEFGVDLKKLNLKHQDLIYSNLNNTSKHVSINSKNYEKKTNSLNDIFKKIDYLKENINSEKVESNLISNESEIKYTQLKNKNENSNFGITHQQNKIVSSDTINNANSNQKQLASEKNINLVLDQLNEELDMSNAGWTEKLVLRIEKGLRDDEKQIELSLKPKELGNLKINLKLKDKGAQILMKVENVASMFALQSNESFLVKTLSEHGLILERINFENSFMDSNNEKNNSSNKQNETSTKSKITNGNNDDNDYNNDNSNYLINIKA